MLNTGDNTNEATFVNNTEGADITSEGASATANVTIEPVTGHVDVTVGGTVSVEGASSDVQNLETKIELAIYNVLARVLPPELLGGLTPPAPNAGSPGNAAHPPT